MASSEGSSATNPGVAQAYDGSMSGGWRRSRVSSRVVQRQGLEARGGGFWRNETEQERLKR